MATQERMPSVFLSHGAGPCFFMDAGGDGGADVDPNDLFSACDMHSDARVALEHLFHTLQQWRTARARTPEARGQGDAEAPADADADADAAAAAAAAEGPDAEEDAGGEALPLLPSAIVIASAHWEWGAQGGQSVESRRGSVGDEVGVLGLEDEEQGLLYDYGGFPPHTYELEFKAHGSSAVGQRVLELLEGAGFRPQATPKGRGFDHGVFIPLKLAYDGAGVRAADGSIPIVQISMLESLDPEAHLRLGEALAPLRDEGVLIIGSGSATHGFAGRNAPGSGPQAWAVEFTDFLHQTLCGDSGDREYSDTRHTLANIMTEAPNADLAHPRIEHFVPLHVAWGAACPLRRQKNDGDVAEDAGVWDAEADGDEARPNKAPRGTRFFNKIVGRTLALDCYIFD